MHFSTPSKHSFEIPDEWWKFVELTDWRPTTNFYPPNTAAKFSTIPIGLIEHPSRSEGVPLFKKYKLIPILLAFISPECALPPIVLVGPREGRAQPFSVRNGFHRYYASVAVGFPEIPAEIVSPRDDDLLREALRQ